MLSIKYIYSTVVHAKSCWLAIVFLRSRSWWLCSYLAPNPISIFFKWPLSRKIEHPCFRLPFMHLNCSLNINSFSYLDESMFRLPCKCMIHLNWLLVLVLLVCCPLFGSRKPSSNKKCLSVMVRSTIPTILHSVPPSSYIFFIHTQRASFTHFMDNTGKRYHPS